MTEQLLNAGAKVFAYEVDENLPEVLHNELPAKINGMPLKQCFKLKMKDILKADFATDLVDFFDLNKPIKVVANLPYYITTPIIFFLSNSQLEFTSLTLMMQKKWQTVCMPMSEQRNIAFNNRGSSRNECAALFDCQKQLIYTSA